VLTRCARHAIAAGRYAAFVAECEEAWRRGDLPAL